jgi:hypothetical protein
MASSRNRVKLIQESPRPAENDNPRLRVCRVPPTLPNDAFHTAADTADSQAARTAARE